MDENVLIHIRLCIHNNLLIYNSHLFIYLFIYIIVTMILLYIDLLLFFLIQVHNSLKSLQSSPLTSPEKSCRQESEDVPSPDDTKPGGT